MNVAYAGMWTWRVNLSVYVKYRNFQPILRLHTGKSGLRGQLDSGFSAHLPQRGLYGHIFWRVHGHFYRGC